jgi:synaptic vesicle membrane protein VAT-1
MRQIWITKIGPPEVLEVKEAPDPEPKAGEVRIRVEASGVNFADIMGRLGLYPDLPPIPVVPGYEVSGQIDAVGAGVAPDWAGRAVWAATRFGGYADTVCVPIKQVFARPAGMSALEAAAIPVNYFTAWQLIVVMGGLKAGETVLIHSAGGGVGIAATQIAKNIGAQVIGTASAAKHAELRRRRRRVMEERISRSRTDRTAWHIRYFRGRERQGTQRARNAGYARPRPLVSVQPAVADECEQGRLRRQPRPYVG